MTVTTARADTTSAAALLAHARELCLPVLTEWVGSLPQPLRLMGAYHFGWCDTSGSPVHAHPGKALRPALVFATATACGARAQAAIPAAAAIELVHNFTLIHDDVLDVDRTRRGRATVWSVWGIADAILLGDALHSLAVRVLATDLPGPIAAAAVTRLETAAIEMCRGQSEDCQFETRPRVGIDDYVRMAMGKTGALMGCACALGAFCAGADAETVSAMERFGRELGLAFQFADDLLGIWGNSAVTGKPAGADLARRKQSLPVVAALQSDTSAAVELNRIYRSTTPMAPAMIVRATALIEAADGRVTVQRMAEQRLAAAIEALPDPRTAGELLVLAQLAVQRDR
ncbi:polyprenyl synthetase family protein [Nocardia sp. JMUB6875]|uniref:geranylgeranyl diphosphate synthase IdsB n=1 Tax=Nocardia sp. JMUB6875 TaxID=3158170 RepID=UPI0032E588CF